MNWADDLSHSCPHRYFTPNFTFAFAFVILKVTDLEIILFRFASNFVTMVGPSSGGITLLVAIGSRLGRVSKQVIGILSLGR